MGQKILVVEDNELNLKLFCDLLRAHGYEAEPVRDGREAVERARSFGPDLVIMDIQMPYISGLELIEQLKADAELKATPIMAVTAYAAKGDEERIRAAGAEGYVSKPISLMRFIEAVRALLAPAPEEAVESRTRHSRESGNPGEADATPPSEDKKVDPRFRGDDGHTVRVDRCFDAPPEKVFDAWLDEASVGRWLFATPDGEMVRVELDPQVGGTWAIVERRDGEEVLHTGTYEEIERPSRLVFSLQVPKYSQSTERVTVRIAPADGGAELTLSQTLPPHAADIADRIASGWATILEGLARELGEKGESE